MRCRRSYAADARRSSRSRPTNHPHEIEAAVAWTPARVYADDYELPDWVAGAN